MGNSNIKDDMNDNNDLCSNMKPSQSGYYKASVKFIRQYI